jgi:TatD DNase family protein
LQKYIDIHTHNSKHQDNVISLRNIIANQPFHLEQNINYSIGLHPWYLELASKESDLTDLNIICQLPNVKAVGEIGLDRLCETSFELQIEMFERQLLLAENLNKPVIIHCVKAISDLISIKKRLKPKVPMVIHGFNQNKQVLLELIRHQFYISIGSVVLDINSNAFFLLDQIPIEQLFFETDESDLHISKIYEMAAIRMKVPEYELVRQINLNFERVFKNLN